MTNLYYWYTAFSANCSVLIWPLLLAGVIWHGNRHGLLGRGIRPYFEL